MPTSITPRRVAGSPETEDDTNPLVTLTVAELAGALRLGSTTEETAEAQRLLSYATIAVTRQAPAAASTIKNEAVIRLASYLYDMPTTSRGMSFANALRNSGAEAMLLPYRIHRAGSVAEGAV